MKQQIITYKNKNNKNKMTEKIPKTKPVDMAFSQLPNRKSVVMKGRL